jgi:site-specific DNA-methyltransferase (adenine-specific)
VDARQRGAGVSESFLNGKVTLHRGDCLEVLPTLEECSIDSCVTDPPYHLTSIVKRFGNEVPRSNMHDKEKQPENRAAHYKRLSKGFMGKQWDGGDIAFRPELWAEVYRVLKPGAHLLAFSGTRTYHRMVCAIEDAGFEVRDQIGYCFGSGFPKSHNIGNGWGTALKPAWEPIVLARKPLSESSIAANVLKHGTGAINVDGCRVECAANDKGEWPITKRRHDDKTWTVQPVHTDQSKGRWPANLIHDGSEEVLERFPDVGGGSATGYDWSEGKSEGAVKLRANVIKSGVHFGDSGSAARFFYTAKADADDRLGSKHPTVKPLDLIQYLVRLVTPKGGTVLDPFAGTGTAGEAAYREGFKAVLVEREEEYQSDIVKRMGLCLSGPEERRRETIKHAGLTADAGPLFGGGQHDGQPRRRNVAAGFEGEERKKRRKGRSVYGVFADEKGSPNE